MDDDRVWAFEGALWEGDPERYRAAIDEQSLMAVPAAPYLLQGTEAIEAMVNTPRWTEVTFSQQHVTRPQDGLVVVGYKVRANRPGGEAYEAYCTSTYRRVAHDEWRVVQHQQTIAPVPAAPSGPPDVVVP
jgi:Domain of unknown function (DUF4440)